jgi:hypothetical protein
MNPQTASASFGRLIDPTQAALNTSPVTQISPKSLQGSTQPQAHMIVPPAVANAPALIVDPQLDELKKHTDLLVTIARNTTAGSRILANPGSFQRDRATNLNGS